jgi:hypothetical protein
MEENAEQKNKNLFFKKLLRFREERILFGRIRVWFGFMPTTMLYITSIRGPANKDRRTTTK